VSISRNGCQNSLFLPEERLAEGEERLAAPRLSSRNAASRLAVARVTRGILKQPQPSRLGRKRRGEVEVDARRLVKYTAVAVDMVKLSRIVL
jgi:hypothetical protein